MLIDGDIRLVYYLEASANMTENDRRALRSMDRNVGLNEDLGYIILWVSLEGFRQVLRSIEDLCIFYQGSE